MFHKLYLNVYLINRSYGGPEEGGWWCDYGIPMHSEQIHIQTAAEPDEEDWYRGEEEDEGCKIHVYLSWLDKQPEFEPVRQRLNDLYERYHDLTGRHERISARCEWSFARDWPETKPHYE